MQLHSFETVKTISKDNSMQKLGSHLGQYTFQLVTRLFIISQVLFLDWCCINYHEPPILNTIVIDHSIFKSCQSCEMFKQPS